MVRQIFRSLSLLSLLLLLLVSSSLADEAKIDREAEELFGTVMSPYCPGRTLSACPSDKARELREELRSELVAGRTVDELREGLAKKFEGIAGKPEGRAANSLVYLGVGVFFLLGLGMVVRNIRNGESSDVEEES